MKLNVISSLLLALVALQPIHLLPVQSRWDTYRPYGIYVFPGAVAFIGTCWFLGKQQVKQNKHQMDKSTDALVSEIKAQQVGLHGEVDRLSHRSDELDQKIQNISARAIVAAQPLVVQSIFSPQAKGLSTISWKWNENHYHKLGLFLQNDKPRGLFNGRSA